MGIKDVKYDGNTATVTLERSPSTEEATRKARQYLNWVMEEIHTGGPETDEQIVNLVDSHTGQLEAANIIMQELNGLAASYDKHKHRKKADQIVHNHNRLFLQTIFLAKVLKELK